MNMLPGEVFKTQPDKALSNQVRPHSLSLFWAEAWMGDLLGSLPAWIILWLHDPMWEHQWQHRQQHTCLPRAAGTVIASFLSSTKWLTPPAVPAHWLMTLWVTSPLSSYAVPSGSCGDESLWLCSVLPAGCRESPQGSEPGSVLTMWGSAAFLRAPPHSVWVTFTL